MPHCYNFLFFLKLGGATLRHIKLRHYGITAYGLITALRHYGIYGLRFLITVFTSRAVTVNGISTATIGVRSETKNVFNCGGYPVDWRSQRSVTLLSLFLSVYTDPSFLYSLTPHQQVAISLFK